MEYCSNELDSLAIKWDLLDELDRGGFGAAPPDGDYLMVIWRIEPSNFDPDDIHVVFKVIDHPQFAGRTINSTYRLTSRDPEVRKLSARNLRRLISACFGSSARPGCYSEMLDCVLWVKTRTREFIDPSGMFRRKSEIAGCWPAQGKLAANLDTRNRNLFSD